VVAIGIPEVSAKGFKYVNKNKVLLVDQTQALMRESLDAIFTRI
jgi:hypothetical protein